VLFCFLKYFPNLGYLFKIFAIISFGSFYYFLSLVDNVFLVVQDREETIPLYRAVYGVESNYQVHSTIPLFSGIFKLGINGILQSMIMEQ